MNDLCNHSRSRKFLPWLISVLTILALVAGCSPCSACGTYVNQDNSGEYLELKKDGTFYLKEIGIGFTGEWEIEEDVLTLSFAQLGLAVRGKLKGDTIIDEGGKIWVRKKGKQITPTIPPPSPAAITREVIIPTPIPSPTPNPDQRGLISAHLSNDPDGPAMTQFPPGTTVVYAVFEYADMAGESIKVRVYDPDGTALFEQTQSYTGSGTESVTVPYGRVFPDGRYLTNFYVNERAHISVTWDVGEPRGLISAHLSDAPDGPAMTRFPSGTTVVYAVFEYADMAGESIKVRVYDSAGGTAVFEQTQSYTGSGTESMTVPYGRVFPNGRYLTNFYVNERPHISVIWDVGEGVAKPTARPTAAPTATSQQGASTPLHKALAGKWQSGTTWIEFSADGTLKLGDDAGVAFGTYKVIDDDTIQIDAHDKAVHGELVDVVSISENALTLIFSSSDQTIKFGKQGH